MTTDHCYWECDYEYHCARQIKKEALESHSWKKKKASTSDYTMVFQNKMNLSLVATFAKIFSSKLSLSPASKKQSNSLWMDLSSKLANNGKLTSNEHKKYLKNNLCPYCGVGDHKLDFYPKKQAMMLQQLLPRNSWRNRK